MRLNEIVSKFWAHLCEIREALGKIRSVFVGIVFIYLSL